MKRLKRHYIGCTYLKGSEVVGLPGRKHPSFFFFNAVKQEQFYDIYLTNGKATHLTPAVHYFVMILKYYTHVISVFSLDSEVFWINLLTYSYS